MEFIFLKFQVNVSFLKLLQNLVDMFDMLIFFFQED